MTVCQAVSRRISNLLKEKDITLYKLEQDSGILHGTMMCIVNERNKNVTLRTLMQLARGFNMTLLEFLNDPVFSPENVEID